MMTLVGFQVVFLAVEMQVTKKMSGCDVSAFVLFEKRHVTLCVTVNAMCDTCRVLLKAESAREQKAERLY